MKNYAVCVGDSPHASHLIKLGSIPTAHGTIDFFDSGHPHADACIYKLNIGDRHPTVATIKFLPACAQPAPYTSRSLYVELNCDECSAFSLCVNGNFRCFLEDFSEKLSESPQIIVKEVGVPPVSNAADIRLFRKMERTRIEKYMCLIRAAAAEGHECVLVHEKNFGAKEYDELRTLGFRVLKITDASHLIQWSTLNDVFKYK